MKRTDNSADFAVPRRPVVRELLESAKALPFANRAFCCKLIYLILACGSLLHADDSNPPSGIAKPGNESPGIQWGPLIGEALFFNAIQNGFRVATQDYTRSRLGGKFFEDWGRSIGNLHGWGDGDDFFTNYVLHPMQGATNGFIFVQNDTKYKASVFGRNRQYWKSRARAALFSFAASEALELGPISEASIGNASQYYPQTGIVDHVITPTIGLAWVIGEDALDRYVVSGIETRTQNVWIRGLVRSTFNPTRSLANLMAMRAPWHRDTRSNQLSEAVLDPTPRKQAVLKSSLLNENLSNALNVLPAQSDRHTERTSLPAFELAPLFTYMQLDAGHKGSLGCIGGGAEAIFTVNRWLDIAADVKGCKMLSPGTNISGDSLTYVAGPGFRFRNGTGWIPYFRVLAGGNKLSIETVNPALKPAQTSGIREIDLPAFHNRYTSEAQNNSFALMFAAGVDHVVNDAFAFRVIGFEDVHLWARSLNGRHYPNNIAVTTGVVVRFGTW